MSNTGDLTTQPRKLIRNKGYKITIIVLVAVILVILVAGALLLGLGILVLAEPGQTTLPPCTLIWQDNSQAFQQAFYTGEGCTTVTIRGVSESGSLEWVLQPRSGSEEIDLTEPNRRGLYRIEINLSVSMLTSAMVNSGGDIIVKLKVGTTSDTLVRITHLKAATPVAALL